ncbi:unnamed protein product (macronuclear) [Paramecium tetraurelia]|uniref:Uncharacterized protein n=1 Tax=Paramecium tetraurelia TaxID=5888 RepID=A0CQG8_PARTE|nr:uncharacterized protein GSPATT00009383001 [Paramecium tetraurelia]CAK73035.1 unnamed protein product [Paramecium tetraurelia]|eukprot:XP_001440432.1 hypothetical protein (macronuclear) [Paramecium tetraurelia strain d4-2]
MRGFLSLAKTIVYSSSIVKPTQQIKMQFRLANQQLASQFRLCSTIQILRLINLQGVSSNSQLEDADEQDLESTISKILSVTLKSNTEKHPLKLITE